MHVAFVLVMYAFGCVLEQPTQLIATTSTTADKKIFFMGELLLRVN